MRAAALAVAVLLLAARPARADDPAEILADANAALVDGDHRRVIDLATSITARQIARADLAEAHRLLGLAYFHLGDFDRAEAEFLDYLRLDLDGRLDPTQVPPEAVTFFEDVRSRHDAELRKLRPRQRRYKLLNLIPPGGQLQNKEPRKAIVIAGLELGLIAANVGSYLILRSWCQRDDFTCVRSGADSADTARKLRMVNILSGVALIGVYAYGVIDGFRGSSRTREREPVLTVAPVEGGAVGGITYTW